MKLGLETPGITGEVKVTNVGLTPSLSQDTPAVCVIQPRHALTVGLLTVHAEDTLCYIRINEAYHCVASTPKRRKVTLTQKLRSKRNSV